MPCDEEGNKEMTADHSEPTWENQLWHARKLETNELQRHASVSRDNRHRCQDCFCCAAWTVLEERKREKAKVTP